MLKFAIFFAAAILMAQFTPAFAQTELITGKELLQQGKTQEALVALQKTVTQSPQKYRRLVLAGRSVSPKWQTGFCRICR